MNYVERECLNRTLRSLVDPRVGIIKTLKEVPPDSRAPRLFHYYALACNTSAFWPLENFAATGGAGVNRHEAMAKAMGEAVERYCAASYFADSTVLATYAELKNGPAPAEYALYSDHQYRSHSLPWQQFTEDTVARWVLGVDLTSRRQVYVPAALVFVPYYYSTSAGEAPFAQPISTGLACHRTFEKAVLSGICEVIERDAFTITWQRQCHVARIQRESISVANQKLTTMLETPGSTVDIFNMTLDHGVPTILSVLSSIVSDEPAFVVAGSADPCANTAVKKSLEELAHTRRYSLQIKRRDAPLCLAGTPAIEGQRDHLNLYCQAESAEAMSFLLNTTRRDEPLTSIIEMGDFSDADAVGTLVTRIKDTGHRVIAVDLTTDDIRETGLCVVRIIIPGYHPLFLGHNNRAEGGRRIWDVPAKMGFVCRNPVDGGNPRPHPYP